MTRVNPAACRLGLHNGKNTLPEQNRDFDFDIVLQPQAAGGTLHQKRRAASQFSD
jgi:hypothetical protein